MGYSCDCEHYSGWKGHTFVSFELLGENIAREAIEIPLKFISALVIVTVVLSLAQRKTNCRNLRLLDGFHISENYLVNQLYEMYGNVTDTLT